MKKFTTALILLTCAALLTAQTTKPAPKTPAKSAAPASKSAAAETKAPADADSSPLVTGEEVDSFMKHMFGFQPGMTWKITDISATDVPGVTRVTVQIGDKSQSQSPGQSQAFFVLPGGKFAMVGEMLPFGADPFAPVRTKLDAEAHGAVRGSKSAPVTIVEFTDLECPYCKNAQPLIEQLVAESPNAKLIYQPFPLPMHPWAKLAAGYAQCVMEKDADAGWRFTDSVYASQADITEANAKEKLDELVRSVGADPAAISACATKPETLAKIQKSIDLGLAVGVSSTPTLFIEGRKILGITAESLPQLKAMIDYDAKQKQQP